MNRRRARPDTRLAARRPLADPADPDRGAGARGAPPRPLARSRCRRSCSRTTRCSRSTSRPDSPCTAAAASRSASIERLRHARPDAQFLELVHRLDRDTSGVLLVAKKRAALTALHAQLRDGRVDKRYLVLVRGKWRDAVRSVELRARDAASTGEGERRVRVDAGGRAARTIFRRVRDLAGPRAAARAARSRARDRAHAPDPRAPHASRLSARRRRQVRRLRVEPRARAGRASSGCSCTRTGSASRIRATAARSSSSRRCRGSPRVRRTSRRRLCRTVPVPDAARNRRGTRAGQRARARRARRRA